MSSWFYGVSLPFYGLKSAKCWFLVEVVLVSTRSSAESYCYQSLEAGAVSFVSVMASDSVCCQLVMSFGRRMFL